MSLDEEIKLFGSNDSTHEKFMRHFEIKSLKIVRKSAAEGGNFVLIGGKSHKLQEHVHVYFDSKLILKALALSS